MKRTGGTASSHISDALRSQTDLINKPPLLLIKNDGSM